MTYLSQVCCVLSLGCCAGKPVVRSCCLCDTRQVFQLMDGQEKWPPHAGLHCAPLLLGPSGPFIPGPLEDWQWRTRRTLMNALAPEGSGADGCWPQPESQMRGGRVSGMQVRDGFNAPSAAFPRCHLLGIWMHLMLFPIREAGRLSLQYVHFPLFFPQRGEQGIRKNCDRIVMNISNIYF